MKFKIISSFKPTGDQPEAIEEICEGFNNNLNCQTLQGVTGSGKTFTVANVVERLQKPTLVLAHNKTLAAQLYSEFKSFFPENAVEYFVSYYDYYQPEAYIPSSGLYIEKDLSINDEIEKLRLSTTSSLLSGRRDIIVVASVSCLYGIGNPNEFKSNMIQISEKQLIPKMKLIRDLVKGLYSRTTGVFSRGNFRVKGDIIDVYPGYSDVAYKIYFFGDEIDEIEVFNPIDDSNIGKVENLRIFPANIFVTSENQLENAIKNIQFDLKDQIEFFKNVGRNLEAKRIEERTNFDLEMIKELGYCSGIENYSRYLDGRKPGTRPFCLLDYFPNDYMMVVDESHVTISQVHAMYGGDRSRKENLVEYGFRLPAALDNRPLKFEEFEELQSQVLYVSATPSDYEFKKSNGLFIEQIIRPTGLLDPIIDVRKSKNQIDDLIEEIQKRVELKERTLVTTLTKRMAEELTNYLAKIRIKSRYIHSDVETLERVEIMQGLRKGDFDVLVGVNLLREGLDLPEVSLVVILDADKEGFLRSNRSLTQTIGRAARNINGMSILYADRITDSMKKTIEETKYRREKQKKFNKLNNVVPRQIEKTLDNALAKKVDLEIEKKIKSNEESIYLLPKKKIDEKIRETRKKMEQAAKNLDFMEAARLRDELKKLKENNI